jgi:hypothetical protein
MTEEKKKITLQEAIKRKLAEKKQEQANQKNAPKGENKAKAMKNQITKKPNNQHRRTGGS